MRYMAILGTVLAFGLLPLSAAPVAAAERSLPSVRVATADLDLTTDRGRARLDRRLERAVATVCGGATRHELGSPVKRRQCERETRAVVFEARDLVVAAAAPSREAAMLSASAEPF
jgi:UrcA family protein